MPASSCCAGDVQTSRAPSSPGARRVSLAATLAPRRYETTGLIEIRADRRAAVPPKRCKLEGGRSLKMTMLHKPKRILVPSNGTPASEEAGRIACDLARRYHATVTLVYVTSEKH